jgi:peroxiredoxin Q/BCP
MSELKKYKVAVFGASVDKPEKNKEFSDKEGYNFVLLSDPDKTYAKQLGVLAPMGFAQRWTYVIDDHGVIRDIDKKVAVANHGKDLTAKLEALGIPKR